MTRVGKEGDKEKISLEDLRECSGRREGRRKSRGKTSNSVAHEIEHILACFVIFIN